MPAPFYRIRDFKRLFAVSQSKKMRDPSRAPWVPVPISWEGRGFMALMEQPNGLAIFGAFILIVEVAARCEKPGDLISDRKPMTPTDVARKVRADKATMEAAFKILSSNDYQWLELVGSDTAEQPPVDHQSTADLPPLDHPSTAGGREERRGEEKRGEESAHAREGEFFPKEGLPYRLSQRLRDGCPLLDALTPGVLTSTVFLVAQYQTMPEVEWFRAADEFKASVNGAGQVPDVGPARGLQAYLRTRFNEWDRQQAADLRFEKKFGAPPTSESPARFNVPTL